MQTTMGRQAYPSDVTDAQWESLDPLIASPDPQGRPAISERREIVNAILYVLHAGCPWRSLPHDLPAWQTVSWYFRRWQRDGTWKRVWRSLHRQVRVQAGHGSDPQVGMLDSQTVKTGPGRGSEKGYDLAKNLWTQAASGSGQSGLAHRLAGGVGAVV